MLILPRFGLRPYAHFPFFTSSHLLPGFVYFVIIHLAISALNAYFHKLINNLVLVTTGLIAVLDEIVARDRVTTDCRDRELGPRKGLAPSPLVCGDGGRRYHAGPCYQPIISAVGEERPDPRLGTAPPPDDPIPSS